MLPTVEAAPAKSNFEDDDYEKRLASLIEKIARGDQAALGELYDQTSPVVFSLACRITGDRSLAEEVACDVFTYVWRQASKYQADRGVPSVWLLMLTHSRSIDCIRSRTRRELRHEPIGTEAEDSSPDPEENAIFAGRRERVRSAMAVLPQKEREAIELAFFSGFSQNEISVRTGTPLGTVKSRIRVGMTRLRSLLSAFEGDYVS